MVSAYIGVAEGTLDTGVHVSFVIVADIDHVVVTFHGAGKGLESDIIGTAISAEGDEFMSVFDFAFFL